MKGLIMTMKCTTIIITAILCNTNLIANPLTPLSGRDVGNYAAQTWSAPNEIIEPNSYWDRTRDLTFVIRNVFIRDDESFQKLDLSGLIKEVENGLKYSPPKTMIIRVDFWGNNGKERIEGTMQNVDVYIARMDKALKQLEPVLDKIHGISISEENVPYNGRTAVLEAIYKHCKAKYPNVMFYQWWTPNTAIPDWYEGIYLSCDGWIIDTYSLCIENYPANRYHMSNDPYRRLLQKYIITGKPLIATIWASSEQSYFFDVNDPNNKTHINMWQIMDHQFQLNLDYDVPTMLYWTNNHGGVFFPLITDSDLLNKINQRIAQYVAHAKALPAEYTGSPAVADYWMNDELLAKMTSDTSDANAEILTYVEDFNSSKFLDQSSGSGFRDLIWSPGNLGIIGYKGRNPCATIIYTISSDVPISWPQVTVAAVINSKLNGSIVLSISADGKNWSIFRHTSDTSGVFLVTADTDSEKAFVKLSKLWVKIDMKGKSGIGSTPPATMQKLTVSAKRYQQF